MLKKNDLDLTNANLYTYTPSSETFSFNRVKRCLGRYTR